MAEDFDADAAVSPSEAIRQLREIAGDGGGAPPAAAADDAPPAGDAPGDTDPDKDEDAGGEPAAGKGKTGGDAGDADGDEDKGDEPDGETPEEKKARTANEEFVNKKYGGDFKRMADGVVSMQNSVSRLVERIEELEAREERGEEKPHPDLEALVDDAKALEEDLDENAKLQQGLVRKGEGIRDEIQELKGRMAATESPDDKARIESKIDSKKADLARLSDRWVDIQRENKRILREQTSLERRKTAIEAQAKLDREQAQVNSVRQKKWFQEQRKSYARGILSIQQTYNVDDDVLGTLDAMIHAELRRFLQANPEGDEIDIEDFITKRAAHHTTRMKIDKRTVKRGNDKRETVPTARVHTPPSRPGAGPSGNGKPNRLSEADVAKNAEQARLHARKVMGQ